MRPYPNSHTHPDARSAMLRQDTSTRNSRIRANWYRYIIWAESTHREQWGYIVEETSSQVYLPRAMVRTAKEGFQEWPSLSHIGSGCC